MPLRAFLQDPESSRLGKLGLQRDLEVSVHPGDPPDVGTKSRFRYFTGLTGSTGTDGGTTNMNVDGSATAQEFYIGGADDYDIRVMGIAVVIADSLPGGVAHNTFGGIAALGTGWDLIVTEAGEDSVLVNKATTSGQVIAFSGFGRPYGDGATAWELVNWTGNDDAQTIYFTISDWVPGGIRIGMGTQDRLRSVVNDDLTGLTEFTVRAFGYRHYREF